jgi:hypothetical protein
MRRLLIFLLAFTVMATAQKTPAPPSQFPNADELNRMAARFAPVPLVVDLSGLSAGDQKALAKLVEAARIVNPLFMEQLWSGNLALYHKLQQDKSPLGRRGCATSGSTSRHGRRLTSTRPFSPMCRPRNRRARTSIPRT